jgi:hypothetical protein
MFLEASYLIASCLKPIKNNKFEILGKEICLNALFLKVSFLKVACLEVTCLKVTCLCLVCLEYYGFAEAGPCKKVR